MSLCVHHIGVLCVRMSVCRMWTLISALQTAGLQERTGVTSQLWRWVHVVYINLILQLTQVFDRLLHPGSSMSDMLINIWHWHKDILWPLVVRNSLALCCHVLTLISFIYISTWIIEAIFREHTYNKSMIKLECNIDIISHFYIFSTIYKKSMLR